MTSKRLLQREMHRGGIVKYLTDDTRDDPRAESQPGSVHGLWRIVRCLARNAFPPSHHPVRPDDLHQGDAALMRSPG
jgi:hypothetical protein